MCIRDRKTRAKAKPPVAGRVMIQAQMMRSTTLSLRALKRLAQPTPMMLVVMAWVVETGLSLIHI